MHEQCASSERNCSLFGSTWTEPLLSLVSEHFLKASLLSYPPNRADFKKNKKDPILRASINWGQHPTKSRPYATDLPSRISYRLRNQTITLVILLTITRLTITVFPSVSLA